MSAPSRPAYPDDFRDDRPADRRGLTAVGVVVAVWVLSGGVGPATVTLPDGLEWAGVAWGEWFMLDAVVERFAPGEAGGVRFVRTAVFGPADPPAAGQDGRRPPVDDEPFGHDFPVFYLVAAEAPDGPVRYDTLRAGGACWLPVFRVVYTPLGRRPPRWVLLV